MTEDSLYQLDRELRITYGNTRALAFMNRRGEVRGRALLEVFPGLEGTEVEARLRRALARGEEQHFEAPSPSHPGHFWEMHVYPTGEGLTVCFRDAARVREGEAAREGERHVARAMAVLRDPFAVVDRDLRLLYLNPAAEAYVGAPASAVLFRRLDELFPQFAGSPLEQHLRRAQASGEEDHFEIESRLRPGARYEVHLHPGPEGTILYYRDVTARRRDAEELDTTQRLMRIAQEMAHVGTWMVEGPLDLAAARVVWSDETYRLLGYEPGEIVPTVPRFLGHVHPADRGRVEQAVAEALGGPAPYEVEHRLLRRDGAERVLHQWGVVQPGADGRPWRVLGACQDVTEAREREEAVRRAREQLQLVTDTMAAHVARCSRDQRYLWVSRAYAEARGYTPEEIVGRTLREVLGDSVAESIQPHVDRVLRGERHSYEERVNYQGRGPTWIEAHYEPTFGPDGRPDGFVAVVVDVDARRKAEEALREADRRKDEFLAVLAHELRNPLAPIRNSVHVLQRLGPREPRVQKVHEMVERQVAHMARLLDDLLDVSRITRGKVLLRKEPLDLREVVRGTAEDLRLMLEKSGQRLALSLPEAPLPVVGDATRLAQVVGNLLQNAHKFTNPGGHVAVAARAEGGFALVSVTDDGVGMDAGILPRVFEPFSQADRSLDRSGGGLGLGLALVRGLTELHGGSVAASSRGPGLGSEFTVFLPLAAAPPASARLTRAEGGRRRRQVLVVEDNRDVAESVRLVLEAYGHRVAVAHDGARALELARDVEPDVVLCDIGLPGGMDGYAVARALRGQSPGAPHLVALSGYGQEEDKSRAAAAGFDHHLTKPVDPAGLGALLEELG